MLLMIMMLRVRFVSFLILGFFYLTTCAATCPDGFTKCRGEARYPCINRNDLCNGRNDCGNNYDEDHRMCAEYFCPNGTRKCRTATRPFCQQEELFCNGVDDCGDLSDESPDVCPPVICDDPNDIPCPGGLRRCIMKWWLCDGENDCGDNSDEEPIYCPADQDDCDVYSIQLCDTGSRSAYQEFSSFLRDPYVYIFIAQSGNYVYINTKCEYLNKMEQCVENSGCEVEELDYYLSGMWDQDSSNHTAQRYFTAMQYLCSDDVKPVFMNYTECISLRDWSQYTAFEHRTRACNVFHDEYNCEKLTQYFSCLHDVVADLCDNSIADFFVNANKKINNDPCAEGTTDTEKITAQPYGDTEETTAQPYGDTEETTAQPYDEYYYYYYDEYEENDDN